MSSSIPILENRSAAQQPKFSGSEEGTALVDENLPQFALTALVTLMVVVDPVGVAPTFLALSSELRVAERNKILQRAAIIAFGVTLFFLFAGHWLLSWLGVTVHAFSISGGILLFVAAWPMLFGHRPGLQAPEHNEPGGGEDIAIFPLAIPLLSGPGTITTILLLSNQPDTNAARIVLLALIVALVFFISWCVLYAADHIVTRLGQGKVRIMTRVLGIVLAALAVQFVLNGIGGFYQTLNRSLS
jgi:multiple antibiotic resistance protein